MMKMYVPLSLIFVALASPAAPLTEKLPPSPEKAARAVSPPAPKADGTYGQKFALPGSILALTDKNTAELRETLASKEVVVKAKVQAVCPKKGCWMEVAGKDQAFRVTFEDYGFFVPVELVGREVALKGHFVPHQESVAEQRHLAEDARKSKAEIEAIKTEKTSLRFVATGVQDLSVPNAR